MADKQKMDEFFWNRATPGMTWDLLRMYLEHDTSERGLAGYTVDAEAYLDPGDEAAHSYGLRRTSRVRAMYEKPGTIHLYTMHIHRTLNIVTQSEGIPQGVMIRAVEPVAMANQTSKNRSGKTGLDISNGPGKSVEALAAPQGLHGQSIADSSLRLVFRKRKASKKINALLRISILNKGIWTEEPLCFVMPGNPYISLQRKSQIEKDWGWRKENEKEGSINIFRRNN